ncbi:MAG TPA: PxKF domain-containing protein [Thermomicrobiaceae bacterium]|nr:PxKF domain-containing protein [Thermomicrobiaceae bacterium]
MAGPYQSDALAPSLHPSVCPNPVLLNGSASATPNDSDATSVVASSSCDSVGTSSVGVQSVSCSATDNAGDPASASAGYTVTYQFSDFASPLDGGVLNVAKPGQIIPLKWLLTDANGAPVTSLSSVSVSAVSLSCAVGTTQDQVEGYATGASGLQNLGDGYYQYNWKTPKSYAGSCKTLRLDLEEGSSTSPAYHTAAFKFTK